MEITVGDFDTLQCPHCDEPVRPRSVSAGPSVGYRCRCGTSWRINRDGNQTHLRLPAPAPDHVGIVGPFIIA
jgi:hypothetical protein